MMFSFGACFDGSAHVLSIAHLAMLVSTLHGGNLLVFLMRRCLM